MNDNFLRKLGLDEDSVYWAHLAACNGMHMSLFFESYESDEELAKAMDSVCLSCPVIKKCLEKAIEDKDYGLRGGFYLTAGKVDPDRNKHKTPEVMAELRKRLSE